MMIYWDGSMDHSHMVFESASYGIFPDMSVSYAYTVLQIGALYNINYVLLSSYGLTFIRSPAIDTVADSIFYVATDGGAYISDYLSTYSYGSYSPNPVYIEGASVTDINGTVQYGWNVWYDSYGDISLVTNVDNACATDKDGLVISAWFSLSGSYGYLYIIRMRFTSRIKITILTERNDKL